jgi:hypothetical protein
VKLPAEALPYYDKLLAEFETSEFLEDAKARRDEVKAEMNLKTDSPASADREQPKAAADADTRPRCRKIAEPTELGQCRRH